MRAEAQDLNRGETPGCWSRLYHLSIIVAMGRNRVIGANGTIPWRLPNELQLFKRVTMGHHIIMGRKTWESIGRLLPGRTTVVVTRQKNYTVPGAIVVASLQSAIDACSKDTEIFVVGGGELYRQALPLAHRIYLTTVDAAPAGDTLMPEFDRQEWREISAEDFAADERHAYGYRFSVLEKIKISINSIT
jgi:dihydrofolate reductase